MAKVWKVLALLLVITALVWLTTLWRWQSAHVDPSSTDVVVHLAALPVVLTAALLAMLLGIQHLRRYAASPVAAAPSAAKAAAGSTAADPPQSTRPTRHAGTRVLAAKVELRAGSTWADARAAIADGACKVDLDPNLKDDDGIAVFTAPLAELATDAVSEALDDLAASREQPGAAPTADVLRTLALLESVIGSMHDTVEGQWPALAAPLPSSRNTPTAAPGLAAAPVVSIRVGIPARWPAATQQLASAYIERLFEPHLEAALKAAGQSRAMAQTARPAVQLHIHPTDGAEAFWALMEQQLHQWGMERQPGLLWALAADSLVSEEQVASLASSNDLFSGRNQRGRVPGEAAAALLLASGAWSPAHDAPPAVGTLHRASIARRDKSADASGRVTAQVLMQAVADTLQAAGIEPSQVELLTTDADHRASRTAEVYETAQALLPHLDTGEQALRLGLGCGDVGIARLLACTALTLTQVEATATPALVLGTHSPFDRLAVLVTPVTPAADLAAAAPASAA